jgi:transcriptional regulator
MAREPVALIQGTLELLILETLRRGDSMHGFEILRWIHDTSGSTLTIEEGSLYPALHRMEQRGWIVAEWGVSERGRRAKYYSLAQPGRRQLAREERNWMEYVSVVGRILQAAGATA